MTTSADLKKAKRALRREVLARREALSDAERRRAGEVIVERFLELPEVVGASMVMAFWSFGSEVDTEPLLARLAEGGTTIALPRIEGDRLEPRAWRPGEPLEVTWFGASEPAAGRAVSPEAIDVVAVPGVAFDRLGGRIGYGGGFYDRFLPELRRDASRVAIAFACQLVDDAVPSGAFDLPVDVIVTDRDVIRIARASHEDPDLNRGSGMR